jgi:hypothetical protein
MKNHNPISGGGKVLGKRKHGCYRVDLSVSNQPDVSYTARRAKKTAKGRTGTPLPAAEGHEPILKSPRRMWAEYLAVFSGIG